MVITKRENVTKQGFCKMLWRKLQLRGVSYYSYSFLGGGGGGVGRGRGGGRGRCLFEAGRLLTFSAFRMGASSGWALIRGWALIPLNTVNILFTCSAAVGLYREVI